MTTPFKSIVKELFDDEEFLVLEMAREEEPAELEFDHDMVPTLSQDWDELTWEDM